MNLNYERHPLSAVFGDMSSEDFSKLKADIIEQGVFEKDVVLLDGKILDGWHRYRAVSEIIDDLPPKEDNGVGFDLNFIGFDGADAVKFVLAKNLHRRHLTLGQRAALIITMYDWKPHGRNQYTWRNENPNMRSAAEMAEEADVAVSAIKRAKQLYRENRTLFKKVESGELSLNAAINESKIQQNIERRINALFDSAPDLADKVVDGEIAMEDAELRLKVRVENLKNLSKGYYVYAIETDSHGILDGVLTPALAFGHSSDDSFHERVGSYVFKRVTAGKLRGVKIFNDKKSALKFENSVCNIFSDLSTESREVVFYTEAVKNFIKDNFDPPSKVLGDMSLREFANTRS